MTGLQAPCFWVDGSPADMAPVSDRGFQYGDGAFETIRVVRGMIPLAAFHWQRLARACQRLSLPFSHEELDQQLNPILAHKATGVLKVMVTRGSGGRGYNPEGAPGRMILGWFAMPEYPEDWREQGIEVKVCQTRLGHSPALAGLKHLNRLEQVLARGEWQGNGSSGNVGEGLMLDLHGQLIEGTMSNLFLVDSGVITTADLSLCGVAGVMRQWLLDASPWRDKAQVRSLTLDDLWHAEEVFVTNSVMGIMPVSRCDDNVWAVGSLTRSIQDEVYRLFNA